MDREELINEQFGVDLTSIGNDRSDSGVYSHPVSTRNIHTGDGDNIKNVYSVKASSGVSISMDNATSDITKCSSDDSKSSRSATIHAGNVVRENSTEIVSFQHIFCNDMNLINNLIDTNTGTAPFIVGSISIKSKLPVIIGFKALDVRLKSGDTQFTTKYYISLQIPVM